MNFMVRVTEEKGFEGFVDRLMGEYIGKNFKKYGPKVEEYDYCLLTFNDGTRGAIFHFLKSFSCLGRVCCVYYADKEFWSNKEYMNSFEEFNNYWTGIFRRVDDVSFKGEIVSTQEDDSSILEYLIAEGLKVVHPSRAEAWEKCMRGRVNFWEKRSPSGVAKGTDGEPIKLFEKDNLLKALSYMIALENGESVFEIASRMRSELERGNDFWSVRGILFHFSFKGPEVAFLTLPQATRRFKLDTYAEIYVKMLENRSLYGDRSKTR